MKIDKRLKKSSSELGEKAKAFIAEVCSLKGLDFTNRLASIHTWEYGKSELCLWADVLNQIDDILEVATAKKSPNSFAVQCDLADNCELRQQVLDSLKFTALLFEYSFTRGVYMSMEHLITLLQSSEIEVVMAVLNVLYVSSKRTSYLGSLPSPQKEAMLQRLVCLSETWGGRENGFSLAQCCTSDQYFKPNRPATTLHFEFFDDSVDLEQSSSSTSRIHYVHIENIDQINKSAGEIMDDILSLYKVPEKRQISLFTQLRWAKSLGNHSKRLSCISARLLSLSVLIYSNMLQENNTNLLYTGFIEECVEALQLEDSPQILEIKTEILKTLTAIIYLDRNPKLNQIIEATGASAYHGYLPSLVRSCIDNFLEERPIASHNYVIALFSLLYHMAGYDIGAEALISSALTESLLRLVNWTRCPMDSIIYITRAVRIIDLITSVNTQAFQSLDGMNVFINRLAHEIDICRKEEPHQIELPRKSVDPAGETHSQDHAEPGPTTSKIALDATDVELVDAQPIPPPTKLQCCSQRLVLVKSLLNFIKKAISDQQFSENIRHIMDGSLPASLRHIISNPDYYGSMLFLRAIVVVTTFVNQEPSQLTSLQDKGLTDVITHALLIKQVPASREVLAHLPQTFSLLCLNERGLNAFMSCNPFDKLFKVLLSRKYLNAMRKRRNSDSFGDTAISLGTAVDEIMRHQPTLKPRAMEAVIKLLEELCALGSDAKLSCACSSVDHFNAASSERQTSIADGPTTFARIVAGGASQPLTVAAAATASGGGAVVAANGVDETSEEDDDDYEDEDGRRRVELRDEDSNLRGSPYMTSDISKSKTTVPLVEYVQNVMKFIEAILSNNSTDDHAKLFIQLNGLPLLLKVLTLPNLPADFGANPACQNIATVVRYLLSLTRDGRVLITLLSQLNEHCLANLAYLQDLSAKGTNYSHMLDDIVKYPVNSVDEVPNSPLFRAMGCVLSHLVLLNNLNRLGTNQNDVKSQILATWFEKAGDALSRLHELYRVVLWENIILHAIEVKPVDLATATGIASTPQQGSCLSFIDSFGTDLVKTLQNREYYQPPTPKSVSTPQPMDVDEPTSSAAKQNRSPTLNEILKPYTEMTLKVSRHLSELFNLLIRVSVGGTARTRRGQSPYVIPPSSNGIAVVERVLNSMKTVFNWQPHMDYAKIKLWLSYIVSLTDCLTQLLFDDRKQAYHLALFKFYSCGLQHAFFGLLPRVFDILKEYGLSLNEANSQFPLAWLGFVDRLINPQYVTESTYQYFEASGAVGFNANHYLAVTQKMAFEQIVTYWPQMTSVNSRVSDLTLSLLCHIIRSDLIVPGSKSDKDGMVDKKEDKQVNNVESGNASELRQLMDMGFPRDAAIDALLTTQDVDQAAEFLLSMANRNAPSGSSLLLDEEEQIRQAIALSLGDEQQTEVSGVNSAAATSQPPMTTQQQQLTGSGISQTTAPLAQKAKQSVSESVTSTIEILPLNETKPLTYEDLETFFQRDLPSYWLKLVDDSPDLVYRLADLLSVAVKKSSRDWVERLFGSLCSEISSSTVVLLEKCNEEGAAEQKIVDLTDSKAASSLSIRLHLLCLLFEEFQQLCCTLLSKTEAMQSLIKLLGESCHIFACRSMSNDEVPKTTRWLAPLLLCLDAYDRECSTLAHRLAAQQMDKIIWKYWDNRNWSTFTSNINRQITDAFKSGLRSFRFTNNRRRYIVDFVQMIQINLDSGYQRPLIFLPGSEDAETPNAENVAEKKDTKPVIDCNAKAERPAVEIRFKLLSSNDRSVILKALVNMIESPMDADTLHAAFRLCLRLTRDYSFALEFLEMGGVQKLLRLQQHQSFAGLPTIVSLLVRHIIEDEYVLKHAMERVIRHVIQGGVAVIDATSNPNEFNYVMRLLGPVASRNPVMFTEIVKKVMRIKVPPPRKSDDDESALMNSSLPVELRVEGAVGPQPTLGSASREVLSRLLNYLAKKQDSGKDTTDKRDAPLIQKSAVLKLIAELVRSYSAVALFITEYRYNTSKGDLITEDCSALAFLFDHLLVDGSTGSADMECVQGLKALVATLSASNHCEEAQSSLVSEVKGALQRALAMPESQAKHARVCSIASLITLMKDSCPTMHFNSPANVQQQQQQQQQTSGANKTPAQATVRCNNIVKWLLKKKLVSDLAKVPHSLDLASPMFVVTMNCILKPLEELMRLVSAPNAIAGVQKQPHKALRQPDASTSNIDRNAEVSNEATQESLQGPAANMPLSPQFSSDFSYRRRHAAERDDAAATSAAAAAPEGAAAIDVDIEIAVAAPPTTAAADVSDLRDALGESILRSIDFETEHDPGFDINATTVVIGRISSRGGSVASDGRRSSVEGAGDSAGESSSSSDVDDDAEDETRSSSAASSLDDDDDDEAVDDAERRRTLALPSGGGSVGAEINGVGAEGNEHGSVQEDDASEYEDIEEEEDDDVDVDDEDAMVSHEEEEMDDDDDNASDYDEEAMEIGLNDTGNESNEPLGILSDILRRDRFVGGPTANNDYGTVFVTTHGGSGLSIPDVDQFLSAAPEAIMPSAAPLNAVGSTHPLLIRHADSPMLPSAAVNGGAGANVGVGPSTASLVVGPSNAAARYFRFGGAQRVGGLLRQNAVRHHHPHRTYRYVVNAPANETSSNVLQRIFGVGIAQDLIEMTQNLSHTAAGSARFVISEDDHFDIENASDRRLGLLSSTPNSYMRWNDESRILDGDSVHYLIAALRPDIEQHLDACRSVEFEARRQLREKMAAEEERQQMAAKENDDKEKKDKDQSQNQQSNAMPAGAASSSVTNAEAAMTSASTDNTSTSLDDTATTAASPLVEQLTSTLQSTVVDNTSSMAAETSDSTRSASPQESATVSSPPPPNSIGSASETPASNAPSALNAIPAGAEDTETANLPDAIAVSELPSQLAEPAQSNPETAASDLPEGVDPAFLAALPDNIRQEVIADQMRLQRLRQQNQQSTSRPAIDEAGVAAASAAAAAEVSPEFLAALPPELQEEVLAQQRLAQQMLNPPAADAPLDPVAFMETLPPSLRQQILTDADDSQLALLPAHLASEARRLRSQFEMQQAGRLAAMSRQFPFVNLLGRRREPGFGGGRLTARPAGRGGGGFFRGPLGALSRDPRFGAAAGQKVAGGNVLSTRYGVASVQQLLDKDALACLLVLFFVDDPRLHLSRLHKILRSLCCHQPTRDWIVRALLSILQRTQTQSVLQAPETTPTLKYKSHGLSSDAHFKPDVKGLDDHMICGAKRLSQNWLNLMLSNNAPSNGSRIDVFEICRQTPSFGHHHHHRTTAPASSKKNIAPASVAGSQAASHSVMRVHPRASVHVCRHVIDTLIILAKGFPSAFFPTDLQERLEKAASSAVVSKLATQGELQTPVQQQQVTEYNSANLSPQNQTSTPQRAVTSKSTSSHSVAAISNQSINCDFWDVLARLDSTFGAVGVIPPLTMAHRKSSAGSSQTPTKSESFAKKDADSSLNSIGCGYATLDDSPFGFLLSALKYDTIASNEALTDSLLRLLLLTINFLPSVQQEVKEVKQKWREAALAKRKNDKAPLSLLPRLSDLVEIVTRSKFSDECLEQGRGVLLRAAQVFSDGTRDAIFLALVEAASRMGCELDEQLNLLLREVCQLRAEQDAAESTQQLATSHASPKSSVTLPLSLPGRASSHRGIVQNASNKELQLQAMTALTAKASVQQCFLRTLNTLITLRDSALADVKNKAKLTVPQPGTSEQNSSQVASPQQTDKVPESVAEPMEVDEEKSSALNFHVALSHFLPLDELWEHLGDCLNRLSEASDPHIVLVLQPAVEAFFLVHACQKKEKAKAGEAADLTAGRVDVAERHDSGTTAVGEAAGANSPAHLDLMPASPPVLSVSGVGVADLNVPSTSAVGVCAQASVPEDVRKFVKFAEEHRNVLNQILRQSTEHLADGPFAVLVNYTRVLDFDVKRRYFRKELERSDNGYRRDDVAVRVRRDLVFQDSFRELFRLRPSEWKSRFYIIFEGEEGQDAGGLLREWYSIITREIFNPDYALFQTAPGDRVTYMINPSSYINIEHLDYFKFVGRIIAKAIYDNKLLDCFFTRAFYKHILSKQVKYNDLESEDPSFYQSLVYLLENSVDVFGSDLTFSLEVTEFGKYEVRDLKPNGRNIQVTEDNKREYVRLVCQMKMTGAIRQQLNAFLTGFYDIIPRNLISIFNEQELELLISGLPNIDVDDLQANTEYNKYNKTSLQIQWFWRALRSFDQADRAKFLQFVTGTSKVPLQGFAALEGMHGVQRFQIHRDDRSTDRLPTAHTCFNQLDLPPYETYDKLRDSLLLAIRECTEGFGFA